jgi:HEAT repeat protein
MFWGFLLGLPAQSTRPQLSSPFVTTACVGIALTVFSVWSPSQQQTLDQHADQSDQQLLLQFSQQSASQLVARYFQGPSYPLFVIRRLIDLADPRVMPDLRDAFFRESQALTRQSLAAALVRLRDPDSQYFDYLAAWARDAVASDLPYSCGSRRGATLEGRTEFPLEFIAWARAHNLALSDALRRAVIELPAAVEALGEAADRRALAILLRGLSSPNGCVVRTSAFALARLHDTIAVELIIRACNTLRREERPLTAKALLYFNSSGAQRAAESIIADPVLVRSWRIEVNRRGWKSAMRDRAIP